LFTRFEKPEHSRKAAKSCVSLETVRLDPFVDFDLAKDLPTPRRARHALPE